MMRYVPTGRRHSPKVAGVFRQLIGRIVSEGDDIPDWLARKRTVLIPKGENRGEADQYRPFTCLNTVYKLLTGTLAVMLPEHTAEYDYLPAEQLVMRRERRGWRDVLLVNGMVNSEVRHGNGTISVAWVDYKKAFDRVPHGWLRTVLKVTSSQSSQVVHLQPTS